MDFKALHYQKEPLLLANVWDVPSAKVAEKLQFKAIGTSSAAIAKQLGYQDGEEMSFEEMLFIVKRILSNTALPLTVDLEAGYSRDLQEVCRHIETLANLGIAGINLEDSIVVEQRTLVSENHFTSFLKGISTFIKQTCPAVFLNVRTDTFLLKVDHPLQETIQRGKQYTLAGADGIFVPGVVAEADIMPLVKALSIPLNVMAMPKLPDFSVLEQWGVKRISMGNWAFEQLEQALENTLTNIAVNNSFRALFN